MTSDFAVMMVRCHRITAEATMSQIDIAGDIWTGVKVHGDVALAP